MTRDLEREAAAAAAPAAFQAAPGQFWAARRESELCCVFVWLAAVTPEAAEAEALARGLILPVRQNTLLSLMRGARCFWQGKSADEAPPRFFGTDMFLGEAFHAD